MIRHISFALLGMVMALSSVAAANAAVTGGTINGGTVGGSGNVVILDPTSSSFAVGNNNFDTKNLYVFNEVQNFTLLSDLTPDVGTTLAAGTVVSSHFVVFDPLLLETVRATLTFNQPILGIFRRGASLIASDFLGAPSVTYNHPTSFGLEAGVDFVTVGDPTPNSVKVNLLSADTPGDVFRVLTLGIADTPSTSAVPEPAVWMYLMGGFALCGATLRSSRRKHMTVGGRVAI